jgi:hypothetical protein
VAGVSVTLLAAGTCTIQATQGGNSNYGAATPVNQSFQVTMATQTITFGPLANQVFGTPPFTVSATASSQLPVTFSSTTAPVCTVAGATVTLVGTGSCTIQATQPGNSNFGAALPVNQSFSVTQASQTITFAALAAQVLGTAPFAVSATSTSGLTVTFLSNTTSVCTVSGATVTLVSAGTCAIQAGQAGNANYTAAAPITQTFPVTQGTQTITFGTLPNLIFGTPPFDLAATASSSLPVSFASLTPAVCTVQGVTVTLTSVGVCGIQASQPGNKNFAAAAAVNQTFSVTTASQSITFTMLSGQVFGAAPFNVNATATSGLSVTFTSTTPTVCTVSGSSVTVTAAGTCTVQAMQPGNATYATATPINQSFVVTQASQTITFGTLTGHTFGESPFAIAATASSGLAVLFSSTTPTTCTVAGATVTVVGAGTCAIQATQPGNLNYTAASAVTLGFAIAKATPLVTWTAPAAITVGTALSATQLNATANVPGAFVYTPASGTVLQSGSGQSLSVTFTPTDTSDYTAVIATTTISVLQVTVSKVTPSPIPVSALSTTVSVTGSGFLQGSIVLANNGAIQTTFVSATSLTASSVFSTPNSSVSFQVRNPGGALSNTVIVSVGPTISVTTQSLPVATAGAPYSTTLAATLGAPPYSWSATGLPSGLTMSTGGTISGTTTSVGSFLLTVTVTDSNQVSVSPSFTLTVAAAPTITNASPVPGATIASPYTLALTATGGVTPYFFSAKGLPAGLIGPNASGVITGTPTATGTFVIAATVTDSNGGVGSKSLSLTVSGALTITTTALTVTAGSPYSSSLMAAGGVAPFTWTVSGLPAGLTSTAAGTVSGTVPVSSSLPLNTTVTVSVTDANGATLARQPIPLTVVAPPTIVTQKLTPTANAAYNAILQEIGGATPLTWSVSGLPAGLTSSATGIISGTPAASGTATLTVKVTDANQATIAGQIAMTVAPPLGIGTTSLPNASLGGPYSATLTPTGGVPAYSWSVIGATPPGLSLAANGVLSGTPTTTGTFSLNAMVTDVNGATASNQFSLLVVNGLTIGTQSLAAGMVGSAYSATVSATGGIAPYTFSSTTLPAGLSISSTSGTIGGTPTVSGTQSVTINVKDSSGATASQTFQLTVALPVPPTLTFNGPPASATPATQPNLALGVTAAFPVDLTVNLTLTFVPTSGADDPNVQFANGKRTAQLTIPAGGSVSLSSVGLQLGTVAGTATITAQLLAGTQDITPSPAPSDAVTIKAVPPVISAVTATASGGTLTVSVTGFATSRTMTQAVFTFTPASGANLTTTSLTVPASSLFAAWWANSASTKFGSEFVFTQPFTLSGSGTVSSVTVTLTNTDGTSAASTATVH